MWYTIGMKRLVSAVLVMALVVSSQGCATVKNTRIPKAFSDVGVCKHCRNTVALDGLADDENVICPECGARFTAGEARLAFRKKIVSRKNQKTARSFLVVTWLAVSVAGAFYGIPLPPPPIDRDVFSPYRTPFSIKCRRARRAPETVPYAGDILTSGNENLYMADWLPNPYTKDIGPYSVIINDYYTGEGAAPYTSYARRLLGMKN